MQRTRAEHLVERRAELRQLDELCERTSGGAGGVVTVLGEPGIGKSALLGAAAALGARHGLRTLSARAAEIEQGYAFGLVRQLLEPILLDGGGELLVGQAARAAHVFAPPAGPPRADGDLATLQGLYSLLAALARERPLLLGLDDLQWADAPSLRFLLFLARRVESSPILLAAALRSGAESGPLGELVDDPATVRLRPRGLGAAGVGALVERDSAQRPAAATVDSFLRASGGNPFYVLSLLQERGGPSDPLEGLDSAAPDPVVRSIERRLAALPAEARELARGLAVLGAEVEPAEARELAGLGSGAAADAGAALESATLLRVEGEAISFSHPIVQGAVYAAIAPSRRARMHDRAAALLEARGASLDRVAAQLLRTDAPQPRAESVLREAAEDALRRGAPEAACAYLGRILREPLEPADRAEALLGLGIAQARAGAPEAVETLAECAELTAEPRVRSEATIALARMLNAVGRPADAVTRLGEAAAALRPESADFAARLDEELLSLADVDLACRRLAHGYVALPAAAEDSDAFGCAHLTVGRLMAGEDAAATAALAERGLADGVLLEATRTGSALFFLLVFALTVAGGFEAAGAQAEAALALAEEEGSAIAFALASWSRGLVAVRRGALDRAEAELQISLDVIALNRLPTIAQLVFVHFIDLMIERGEPQRVAPAAARAGLDLERLDAGTQGTILQIMRGRLRIAEGRAAEGIEDTLEAAARFASWGVVNPGLYHWHTDTALVLQAAGETERARQLAAEQLRLAEAWGAPRTVAEALRTAALLAPGEEQVERLEAARDALGDSGAELLRARLLTDLGAALRRGNSRSAARPLLAEALELARACGAGPLAERAHTELWATGARPREPLRTGPDNLTPSELRIAGLAAAGRSNAEIAQQLFITVKTVEMHLTRTYRKLDIDSRRDLAAQLAGDEGRGGLESGSGP